MSMKKFNDTLGNRTRDLPTCSALRNILDRVRCFVSNLIQIVPEIWKLLLEILLHSEFDVQRTVHRDIFL